MAQPDNALPSTNPSIPHLDDHLAELSTFLTLHISNLTALKNQLALNAHSPPPDAVIAANGPERNRDNLADQFNVIVVTATFTGGAVVAFLSLMNDVLSAANVPVFTSDRFSLPIYGLVFGIIAFGLDLAVAIFASVNSALATHYRGDPNHTAPSQRTPLIICSWGQFLASIFTGLSIFLLTFAFIPPAAITTGGCYGAGLIISAYFILKQLPLKTSLRRSPLVAVSLTLSTLVFGFSTTFGDISSYVLIPAFALTLLYHIVVLSGAAFSSVLPHVVCLLLLSVLWGVGVVVTVTMPGFKTHWPYIILCSLGSVECVVMAIIAFRTLSMRKRRESLTEEEVMMLGTAAHPPFPPATSSTA